ncbi:MAG: hypothetical protein JKY97_00525, partial [Citromicrobium sp.]|nr:hypothetical protein [Citromicrobium sp.]
RNYLLSNPQILPDMAEAYQREQAKDRRKSTSTTPCDPSASYGGTRDAAKSPRNAGGRCARKNHSGSRIWHRDQVAPPDTRHRRRVSTHDPAQRSHARRKI